VPANSYIGNVSFELERHVCRFTPFYFLVDNEKIIFYTGEDLKWDTPVGVSFQIITTRREPRH
jgi:hypothetical protein